MPPKYLGPKDIAKRIKQKGLGRLKWYCQMCRKQCRDENGFKCHTRSEGHLRQMQLFAQDPDAILGEFSDEFEASFLDLLSKRWGTKRVDANRVYNEFIQDKQHMRMNSTKWETLSSFVQYLGRTSKVTVEETERGLYITWIDRDPEVMRRLEAARQANKRKLDEAQREVRDMEKRARLAAEMLRRQEARPSVGPTTPVAPINADGNIVLSLKHAAGGATGAPGMLPQRRARLKEDVQVVTFEAADPVSIGSHHGASAAKSSPATELERMFLETQARMHAADQKQRQLLLRPSEAATVAATAAAGNGAASARSGAAIFSLPIMWLVPHIVVKVKNREVGNPPGRYFGKKAVVRSVDVGDQTAEIKMHESGHRLRMHQSDMETVVPKPGLKHGRSTVIVLARECRGKVGELEALHLDRYCADIRLKNGTLMESLPYEMFCRVNVDHKSKKKRKETKKRKDDKKSKKSKSKKRDREA